MKTFLDLFLAVLLFVPCVDTENHPSVSSSIFEQSLPGMLGKGDKVSKPASESSGTCSGRCNAAVDNSKPCQCNAACYNVNNGDCCRDYDDFCQGDSSMKDGPPTFNINMFRQPSEVPKIPEIILPPKPGGMYPGILATSADGVKSMSEPTSPQLTVSTSEKQVSKSDSKEVESEDLEGQENAASLPSPTTTTLRTTTTACNLCFKIFNFEMSHSSAVSRCKEEGENGRLPILETEEKFQTFRAKLQSSSEGTYWVGIKALGGAEMSWDDGSKVNKMFWAPGEPNQANEECADMRAKFEYKLNDVSCDGHKFYVTCEIPL